MSAPLRICLDIDGTICTTKTGDMTYDDVVPFPGVVGIMHQWKADGHYIILQTARHMRTYEGNEGKILANGGKLLFDWLERWNVPYDEVYFGKPHADIFIDDAAHQHLDWASTVAAVESLSLRGGRFPAHK